MKKVLVVVALTIAVLATTVSAAFAKIPDGVFHVRVPGVGIGDVNHSHYGAPGQL